MRLHARVSAAKSPSATTAIRPVTPVESVDRNPRLLRRDTRAWYPAAIRVTAAPDSRAVDRPCGLRRTRRIATRAGQCRRPAADDRRLRALRAPGARSRGAVFLRHC